VSREVTALAPTAARSADLYERCRRGDEDAWAEVYARALAALARRRVNHAKAEDIASATVLKLLPVVKRNGVKDPVAFPAYVAIVAVRLFFDDRRAPYERDRLWNDPDDAGLMPLDRAGDPGPDPLARASVRERWAVFIGAVSRLPEQCRTTLRAYFEHIHLDPRGSYKTLEQALRSKRGSIASRVTRCLDALLEDPVVRRLVGTPQ
jgi:DNA-directed RNA polymerase specialized sigma24 family protein